MGGIIRLLERKTTLSDSEKQFIINAVKLQELVKKKTTELNTKLKEMDDKDQFHAMPSYYHQKEHARDILQSILNEAESNNE